MRADNTRHLTKAARSRAEQTRRRAITTLRQLTNTGQPLTVSVLAQHAGVSRSWLYTQPDLLAQIREDQPRPATTPAVPTRQAASDGSLKQRLQLAHATDPRTRGRQPTAAPRPRSSPRRPTRTTRPRPTRESRLTTGHPATSEALVPDTSTTQNRRSTPQPGPRLKINSESLNYQCRKIIKNRGHFPNDDAAVKLLWLAIMNIEDKRARERAKEIADKIPHGQRKASARLVEGPYPKAGKPP